MDKESLYNHLLIYNDTGTCLLQKTTGNIPFDPSMKGILQALFFTSQELNFNLKLISSDNGIIAYKNYSYKDNHILICIVLPNFYGDEEIAEKLTDKLIDYLYYTLLAHIGYFDLFHNSTPIEIEKFKKFTEIFNLSIEYLLSNFLDIKFIMGIEQKIDMLKDDQFSIKHYMDKLKEYIGQDFLCLIKNDTILWTSNEWASINITDRNIFLNISKVYTNNNSDINQIPIYFAKTVLENEANGNVAFKLFTVNLLNDINLVLVSDQSININKLTECINKLDEFFISKLSTLDNKLIYKTNNDVLDSLIDHMVVVNNKLNNYRIYSKTFSMNPPETHVQLNEEINGLFGHFIINNCFSINFLSKTNMSNISDEFYIKSEDKMFYFIKNYGMFFIIIMSVDIPVDNIKSIKIGLDSMKDSFLGINSTSNNTNIINK